MAYTLIQDYHFGYTLFGNKPISFDRYYISPSIDMPACCKKNAKLEVLWDFWEQNNPHISESPFVLKRVKFTEDEIEFQEFYLINRPKCLKKIEKHWASFKNAFPPYETPHEVLKAICEKGPHTIKKHDLLGILLGYGEHNAHLFQMSSDLLIQLTLSTYAQDAHTTSKLTDQEKQQILYNQKLSIIVPKSSWEELLYQYREISMQLSGSLRTLVPYHPLLAIPLPSFRADPSHPETLKILRDYLETQKLSNQLLHHPNFLQMVLNRLYA
ncbi:hypothetical protein [Parachlamydia acanthamoebae]|uniref:Uncharacterized protein n=1 Tax=Parachlamydia acanthamoebae TaxID=83552 RepID=A0A0C1EFC6_9BACT|nr:hypothetical protein [Parachlamydia acanthamoebae]KIA78738.1 hypothetical protein DB43_DL00080 [Parachlamydia acanthamoebae]